VDPEEGFYHAAAVQVLMPGRRNIIGFMLLSLVGA